MKKFTAVAAVCVVGLCSFLVYNNMGGAEKDLPLTATLQAGEEDLLPEGNENTLESLEESTVKDALIQEEKQEKFEWKKKGQEENQTGGNDAATPEATEAVKVESVQEEQGSAEADLPAGSAAAEEPKVMKAVQSPGPGEEKGEDAGDQAVESPQLKALEEDIMNYENTQDNQSATEMQMYWDLVYNKVKGSGQVVSCSYSQSQQLWIIRAKLTDQETEDYVEYYGKEGKVWKAE